MKRVTLFSGHYGSGKTNIAVNYAMKLNALGLPTAIADLDTVNPYFRTKDSETVLSKAGIRVISLPFANTNVDLPSLSSEVYSLVQQHREYAVLDIGGDDDGAYALGRFTPYILEENNYDHFFVVNFFRPMTPDAESAAEYIADIEKACGINRLSELSDLPVAMTAAREDIAEELNRADIFSLKLQKKYW